KDRPLATAKTIVNDNGAGKNHLNIGAVYIKRNDFTLKFMDDWYKLTCELGGWYAAQNAFNILALKYNLPELDDKWNHTGNRHGACDCPIVRGYHGHKGFDEKMNRIIEDLKTI